MNFLLLFPEDEERRFDKTKVLYMLKEIPGAFNIEKGDFVKSVLQCEFSDGSDSTTLRLSDDLKSIVLDGTGVASLVLALEVKKRCDLPIRAVDAGYNFDVSLDDVSSIDELRDRMR